MTISGDGEYTLSSRIVDEVGHMSDWREEIATDSASGVDRIEYSLDGGAYKTATYRTCTEWQPIAEQLADGEHDIWFRTWDRAGQLEVRQATLKVDDDRSGRRPHEAPPTGWQQDARVPGRGAVSTPLSGVKVVRWRASGDDSGEIPRGRLRRGGHRKPHSSRSQVVDNAGNETDLAVLPHQGRPDRAGEHHLETALTGWLKTPPGPIEIEGKDGTGSGVAEIKVELDGKAVSTRDDHRRRTAVSNPVTITGDGVHTLRSRLIDAVGNESEWRTDEIKIDSAAPKTALSCSAGPAVWSRAPVSCTVTADGGDSGLGVATLVRRRRRHGFGDLRRHGDR